MAEAGILSQTKRWSLERVDFAVGTALGVTIRGRFERVAGSYEVGPDGTRIELAVDATSVDTGNGIWDGMLRSARKDDPQVRFTSTRVRETGNGRLRVEGQLASAGTIEPVAFDATVDEVDRGLRFEVATTIDREQLGKRADQLAVFLPATLHVRLQLSP
jgi:polyisoprenoid-binding protein YceI